MRYLGIDYGHKKVGLALSDEGGRMAFPHSVILNDNDFLAKLLHIIESEVVEVVVIGESNALDGTPNAIQGAITDLVTDLTLQTGVPVHLESEQFTTQAAMRDQGRNDQTDASAAAIILNSYLEKQS